MIQDGSKLYEKIDEIHNKIDGIKSDVTRLHISVAVLTEKTKQLYESQIEWQKKATTIEGRVNINEGNISLLKSENSYFKSLKWEKTINYLIQIFVLIIGMLLISKLNNLEAKPVKLSSNDVTCKQLISI